MTDGHAVTILPVPRTCEWRDCEKDSKVSMFITAEFGTAGIAAYCDDCADELEDSENHTPLGVVKTRRTETAGGHE